MKILAERAAAEITVKNSRFLSEVFPCSSQEEARRILKDQKTKYQDATHVVHAFALGLSQEILGMSDDGEPSGTAGRPVLDILKGREATNTVLTVARWFGGTLLGTGGLVKAYGEAARLVLDEAERGGLLRPHVEKTEFKFKVDYSLHGTVVRTLEKFSVEELSEIFGTEVEISGRTASSHMEELRECLRNISNGKIGI